MRILLIEDDKITASVINNSLKEKGYTLDIASDGAVGLEFALKNKSNYSCIILDIGLPDMSGFDICKKIRSEGDETPILILSARDEIDSKVEGLNIGADDYLTKPFDITEFFARINALLRRKINLRSKVIKVRSLKLDPVAHEVKIEGEQIYLSHIEFRLLEYLLKNKGKLVTRSELIDKVWNMQGRKMFSNSLTVHIKELRKKIKDSKSDPMLQTIRGSGYKFVAK